MLYDKLSISIKYSCVREYDHFDILKLTFGIYIYGVLLSD